MPVTIPQHQTFTNFLSRYNRDYESLSQYENIHELDFNPLIKVGDTDKLRYDALFNAMSEVNFNITGSRINIGKLPSINEEIDLSNKDTKENYKNYYKLRSMVRKVAEKNEDFLYSLPDKNKKDFIDQYTNEMYGLWKVAESTLPTKGTSQRDQVAKGYKYLLIDELFKKRMAPLIKNEAAKYGQGWEGTTGGTDVLKRSWHQAREMFGGFLQQASDAPFIDRFGEDFDQRILQSGKDLELDAEASLKLLEQPTGKYLESPSALAKHDMGEIFNPYYVLTKVGEQSVHNIGSTAVSIAGGVMANKLLFGQAGRVKKVANYVLGMGPGLGINYALESGDMYISARDYLNEIRDKAKVDKVTMSNDEFISKYDTFVSPDLSRTADELTDDDIHEISNALSEFYGLSSTMIEGATNLGALAGWAKDFGKVTTTALKEGRRQGMRKLIDKFGSSIMKYKGKTVKGVWAMGREPLQEWLQESTGEYLRAKALPEYRYDASVGIDGAYGGFWFGGGMQAGHKSFKYIYDKKKQRDFDKALANIKEYEDSVDPYQSMTKSAINESVGKNNIKDKDALLKMGLVLEGDYSFIDRITDDPAERIELRKRLGSLASLAFTEKGWGDKNQLKALFKANSDKIKPFFPNATEQDFLRSSFNLDQNDVNEILGKQPEVSKGDIDPDAMVVEDNSVNLAEAYIEPTHDPVQYKQDPELINLNAELQFTEAELLSLESNAPDGVVNPQLGMSQEKYDDLHKRLSDAVNIMKEKKKKLTVKNEPKDKGDPRSNEKQQLIDRLNKVSTGENLKIDGPIVKAASRKNASEFVINKLRDLVKQREQEFAEKSKVPDKKAPEIKEMSDAAEVIKEPLKELSDELGKKKKAKEKDSEVFVNEIEKNALQLYYESGRDYPGVNALLKTASTGTKSERSAEIKALKEWISTIPNEKRPPNLFRIIHKHVVSSYRESIDEEKIGPEAIPDPDKPGSYLTPETDKMEAAMGLVDKATGIDKKRPKTFEVSTKAKGFGSEFSPFNATLDDGRTIEEAYQLDVKGYRAEGMGILEAKRDKGKNAPIKLTEDQLNLHYYMLWEQWADENMTSMSELGNKIKDENLILKDSFAGNKDRNQAAVLQELLDEHFDEETGRYYNDNPLYEGYEDKVLSLSEKVITGIRQQMIDVNFLSDKELKMFDEALEESQLQDLSNHLQMHSKKYWTFTERPKGLNVLERELAEHFKNFQLMKMEDAREGVEYTDERAEQVEFKEQANEDFVAGVLNYFLAMKNTEQILNVKNAADNAGHDIESDEFRSLSKSVTGKEHIDDMTTEEKAMLVKRINSLDRVGVMTNNDMKSLILNVLDRIGNFTRGEVFYHPEELNKMSAGQLAELYQEILTSKLSEGTIDMEELQDAVDIQNKPKIIQAILDSQGHIKYLHGGVGAFPFLKTSTKNRVFRLFNQAWLDSKKEFGLHNNEFMWWSDKFMAGLPPSLLSYAKEWAQQTPKELTYAERFGVAVLGDSVSGYTEEDKNMIENAARMSSESVTENIGISEAQEIDVSKGSVVSTSGDISFREGFNRINATAFKPLGIYIDSGEAQMITSLINKSVDFDSWLKRISTKPYSVPMPDGRTIWETSRDNPELRRNLKQFYLSNLPINSVRVNRNIRDKNTRDNFEFIWKAETPTADARFLTKKVKMSQSLILGKTNPQWARKMHGENYLGDVELVWISGNDIKTTQSAKSVSGEQQYTADGAFAQKVLPRYGFFNSEELMELTLDFFKQQNVVPLFMRGEESMIANVKITKQHYDFSKLGDEYWDGEELSDKMREEYKQTLFGDPYFAAAQVARHEAMKQIMGRKYYTVDAPTIMRRIKAFFTPGISAEGGPASKIVVFDAKDVVFETTFPKELGGKVIKVDAMQNIDNQDQYILDGMTITSESKFMDVYPNLVGTDPRAKRAKTIIGERSGDDDLLIGKHQEMSMYVPTGAKVRLLKGDKVIAEIYNDGKGTNIYANGQYVDHLMTKDEAKIRLGDNINKENEIIEIPSEATRHIQSVGLPKSSSNFPMQLMNYITDRTIQDKVSEMIIDDDHNKSTKSFFDYLFKVSKQPKELDKMIINLSESSKDAPPQYAVENAKLGAGLHPTNQGIATSLAQSKVIKKAMDVLQEGSSLDFRPDHMGMVDDNEIMLPGNVPAIRNQLYKKYADAHSMTIDEANKNNLSVINKWLREEGAVKVLAVRFPVPSSSGYRVFKVKGMLGALAGDSFVISPKVVKEVFEADHDHDTGHISFMDDDILDLLEKYQKPAKGIMLSQYLDKGSDKKYSFSNIEDMYELFDELGYGSQAIGEIVNVTRAAGVINNHFNHMVIDDARIIATPLNAVIKDPNSGIEDTLEEIYRIYQQASFDNAEFRLLKKWNYSQDNLFKLLFRVDNGAELTDEQFNTVKIYLDVIKLNGGIANGSQGMSRYSLSDTFKISEQYRNFTMGRQEYIAKLMRDRIINAKDRSIYGIPSEIDFKEGAGSVHPHEILSSSPDYFAQHWGVDTDELFDVSVEKSRLAHMDAYYNISSQGKRMVDILSAKKGLSQEEALKEHRIGASWAQSMRDELTMLFTEYEQKNDFGLSRVLNQTWDYNDNFVSFAQRWYHGFEKADGVKVSGFKDLSKLAQKYATYEFLHGLNVRNFKENQRYNTFNVRMFPPISKDNETLLDPEIMEKYFKEYNKVLVEKYRDASNLNSVEFRTIPRIGSEMKEYFGCG